MRYLAATLLFALLAWVSFMDTPAVRVAFTAGPALAESVGALTLIVLGWMVLVKLLDPEL